MDTTGTVYSVGELKQNGKYQNINFILHEDPRMGRGDNSYLQFSAGFEVATTVSSLKMGDIVKVTFDVVGRLYSDKKTSEDKSFTYLNAKMVTAISIKEEEPFTPSEALPDTQYEEDDLPF